MSFYFEGRTSDSPYIDMVWRGRAGSNYAPICPAKSVWNLLFLKQDGRVQVSAEGPLTKATPKVQAEGVEWLVIEFTLGTFLPFLPVSGLVDGDELLPTATRSSFHLQGSAWHLPAWDNVETFVERLVRQGLLLRDPIVSAVLENEQPAFSERTVRRRFLRATGLTPATLGQIERAKHAAALLERDENILDVVELCGYADQSHMTRALKHFIGQTPARIARVNKPE